MIYYRMTDCSTAEVFRLMDSYYIRNDSGTIDEETGTLEEAMSILKKNGYK